MKSITEYIAEAAEFEKIKTQYREYAVVTLVRRENINCASLTEEEFVKIMGDDLKSAINEYVEIVKPLNEKAKQRHIEYKIKTATKYAEKKWKTQKKRDEYIENIRKNAESEGWYMSDPKRIFFDFDVDKGSQGISSVCILKNETDEKQLKQCFEEVKNNRYFKKATGWAFKYESNSKEEMSTYCFRPYVDLLLDETTRAEQKRDEENLTQAIQNFYANSNYWGD